MTDCNDRIKNIIFTDKNETSIKINKVLKAEILYVLQNYMNIASEDLNLEVNLNKNNLYELKVIGVATSIKNAKIF